MKGSEMKTRIHVRGRWGMMVLALVVLGLLAGGCDPMEFSNPERSAQGLVVILPGIEGESLANHNIRQGIYDAGVPYALEIYSWGFPIPGIGLIVNQTDSEGNRRAAARLAERVVRYQKEYPNRPVYLVGHSGGGGVAVFTLEEMGRMPGAKPIEGAFLLSASISADYPLNAAIRMTRRGLVNVYNPDDTGLLGAGTAIFGNVDGGHGDSAGRTGFQRRHPKLFEKMVTSDMVSMPSDPHYLATNADLIARHAPGWVRSDKWPPPRPAP